MASRGRGSRFVDPSHRCNFCAGSAPVTEDAARKSCPVFRSLKDRLEARPYVEPALKPTEERGFAASGMMLFRRARDAVTGAHDIQILVAREVRKTREAGGGDKLNFLSGKRHLVGSKPLDLAIRKLDEETGGCMRRSTIRALRGLPPLESASSAAAGAVLPPSRALGCPIVLWAPASKFALYFFEAGPEEEDIDIRACGTKGSVRLEWVSRSQLQDSRFQREQVHIYSADMVDTLKETNVFSHLETLFDIAAAERGTMGEAPGAGGSSTEGEGGADDSVDQIDLPMTKAAAAEYLDVLRAVRATAREVRPLDRMIPLLSSSTLTFEDIREQTRDLLPSDVRKLRLCFRPHNLQRKFLRELTEEEKNMSALACRFLDLLFPVSEHPLEPGMEEGAPSLAGSDEVHDSPMVLLRKLHELIERASPGAAEAAERELEDAERARAEWLHGHQLDGPGAGGAGSGGRGSWRDRGGGAGGSWREGRGGVYGSGGMHRQGGYGGGAGW
jgi:hypothetical protein